MQKYAAGMGGAGACLVTSSSTAAPPLRPAPRSKEMPRSCRPSLLPPPRRLALARWVRVSHCRRRAVSDCSWIIAVGRTASIPTDTQQPSGANVEGGLRRLYTDPFIYRRHCTIPA